MMLNGERKDLVTDENGTPIPVNSTNFPLEFVVGHFDYKVYAPNLALDMKQFLKKSKKGVENIKAYFEKYLPQLVTDSSNPESLLTVDYEEEEEEGNDSLSAAIRGEGGVGSNVVKTITIRSNIDKSRNIVLCLNWSKDTGYFFQTENSSHTFDFGALKAVRLANLCVFTLKTKVKMGSLFPLSVLSDSTEENLLYAKYGAYPVMGIWTSNGSPYIRQRFWLKQRQGCLSLELRKHPQIYKTIDHDEALKLYLIIRVNV